MKIASSAFFAVLTNVLAATSLVAAVVQQSDTIRKVVGSPMHSGVSGIVQELSVGVTEGDPNYTFASITDIAVGGKGWMLILDAPAFRGRPALRLYDGKGRFVRDVGRLGRGPGEYVQPAAVAVMPDGRYLLLDPMFGRINVYNASGGYAENWTVPILNVTRGVPGTMRVSPTGVISIRFNLSQRLTSLTNVRMTQAVVRIHPTGDLMDTLPAPALPDLSTEVRKIHYRGSAQVGAGFPMPFATGSFWQYSPHGYFVTAMSDRYAIDLRLPRDQRDGSLKTTTWRLGDPVLSIRRSVGRVGISATERAEQKAFIEQQLRRIKGSQSGRVQSVPRLKPFFQGLYIGDEGRLWVKVHVASERYSPVPQSNELVAPLRWREGNVFDVFEPSGLYIGRVRVPDGMRILKFAGDRIWAVSKGDFDVEVLKQYRINWN